MSEGFLFDFSAPADDGAAAAVEDFMSVPEGHVCHFDFHSEAEVAALAAGVLGSAGGSGGDAAAPIFLETVLPFVRGGAAPAAAAAGSVSIFHRQAPRVDALELEEGSGAGVAAVSGGVVNANDRRDIVQGAYYGGLKVWSCAPDVAEAVIFGVAAEEEDGKGGAKRDWFGDEVRAVVGQRGQEASSSPSGRPAVVIAELGCGQSLPTLAAIRRLRTDVDPNSNGGMATAEYLLFLHDYNKEVISEVSVPNAAYALAKANAAAVGASSPPPPPVTFATGHGDWANVAPQSFYHPQLNPSGHVDIIIAADVTFDMAATEKFLCAAARNLRPPTSLPGGFAIVGTKDYYFGTNGGLEEMKEVIRRRRLPLELNVLGRRGVGTMVRVLVTLRRV